MDYLSSCLYGLVQGITEFLPVSSSAHLALIPSFLKMNDPGVAFDLWMHVGTGLAVFIYFRKLIIELLTELFSVSDSPETSHENSAYLFNLIVATGSSGVIVLLLKDVSEYFGRNPILIAVNLVLFGIVMWGCDFYARQRELLAPRKDFLLRKSPFRSIFVGVIQSLAIFPGVSRSGITLSVTRLCGLSRERSAVFSFLLSLPIIFIGAATKFRELPATINWMELVIGVSVSFVVGYITIHFFLGVIKRIGLGIFCVYRIALAGIIYYYLI